MSPSRPSDRGEVVGAIDDGDLAATASDEALWKELRAG